MSFRGLAHCLIRVARKASHSWHDGRMPITKLMPCEPSLRSCSAKDGPNRIATYHPIRTLGDIRRQLESGQLSDLEFECVSKDGTFDVTN